MADSPVISSLHQGFLPGPTELDAYGSGGFRFGGMSHKGSILALPGGVHAWDAVTPADFSLESFAKVLAEGDAIRILVIGCGKDIAILPAGLADALRQVGIGFEVMSTSAAARTYQVLFAENRQVGAALLAVDG